MIKLVYKVLIICDAMAVSYYTHVYLDTKNIGAIILVLVYAFMTLFWTTRLIAYNKTLKRKEHDEKSV